MKKLIDWLKANWLNVAMIVCYIVIFYLLFSRLAAYPAPTSKPTALAKPAETGKLVYLPLLGMVVILDLGHGDREVPDGAPHDPGCHADCTTGRAHEAPFTWETGMRLKRLLEAKGAIVHLTTYDPYNDYRVQDWGPMFFPTVENSNGPTDRKDAVVFGYKTLVDIPNPINDTVALRSRYLTANRLYQKYKKTHDVYFLSIHFDSLGNTDISGMSFSYWYGTEKRPFVNALANEIRIAKRHRVNAETGKEFRLHGLPDSKLAVLRNSSNVDAYLIELGNIQNAADLWRMRHPKVREEYARIIVRALESVYVPKKH